MVNKDFSQQRLIREIMIFYFCDIDIVLQDFCEVVGHYDNTVSHERRYFRKVIADVVEPIPGLGVCTNSGVDTAWESRASECTRSELSDAMRFSHKLALFVSIIVSSLTLFQY